MAHFLPGRWRGSRGAPWGGAHTALSLDNAPCNGRHPEEVPHMRPAIPMFLSLVVAFAAPAFAQPQLTADE